MQLAVGSVLEGKVTGITKFGVFVDLGEGKVGMVHISEVASTYVREISDHIKNGEIVKVKVLSVSDDGKISLSIKKAQEQKPPVRRGPHQSSGYEWSPKPRQNLSFEDMMSKFKQSSDEKMLDLKKIMDSKRGSSPKRGPK